MNQNDDQQAGGRERSAAESDAPTSLEVDGIVVSVSEVASLLDACDQAGRYVPRLCRHSGLGYGERHRGVSVIRTGPVQDRQRCGLCLVRVDGKAPVLACETPAAMGAMVSTDDAGLREERRERLAAILAWHPHICLSCAERDGCDRKECTYGNCLESRCCDELGRCEFGKVVAFIDPRGTVARRAVPACRSATVEGRIRREPGLCLGCGRCVDACDRSDLAGQALELVSRSGVRVGGHTGEANQNGGLLVASPKKGSLRESGCTFCGLCVLVCPTGAITAPGDQGALWLARCRKSHGDLHQQMLPAEGLWLSLPADLEIVPSEAGVFTICDGSGEVLHIAGVPDLRQGVADSLGERSSAGATLFRFEVEPLYTQRESEILSRYLGEHGRLPGGNVPDDDLFEDDMGFGE